MDMANPYQVHDSTVKLVILTLNRDEGRLPSSVAADYIRTWSDWKGEPQAEVVLRP
jgi:hypothetical protein